MASGSSPKSTCAQAIAQSDLPRTSATHTLLLSTQQAQDYDFVEEPSHDFFCPVTLELLLEPMLTTCCGHHVSQDASTALRSEGKPCPMCNEKNWSSVLDKFHSRRVYELRVRCFYRASGCDWVGEMNELQHHTDVCIKRPWECQYCGLKCTYGEGEGEHWPTCSKFPEPCPNGCEVGSVQRCNVEQHRSVCSLEPVCCEMREFGCSAVVLRKDLATHMRESELQHLTGMAVLNLRLTRQLQQDLAEKDKKIAQLQQEMTEQRQLQTEMKKEMAEQKQVTMKEVAQLKQIQKSEIAQLSEQEKKEDQLITDLQKEMKREITSLGKQSAAASAQVEEMRRDLAELKEHVLDIHDTTHHIEMHSAGQCAGYTLCKVFTFDQYSLHKGRDEEVQSELFYSHQCGYLFKLCIKYFDLRHNDIGAYLHLLDGEYDDDLPWPVEVKVRLELLNQAGDHHHVVKMKTLRWEKEEEEEYETIDDSIVKYSDLEKRGDGVQYMMNNCLLFRLHLTVQPA